MPEVTLTVRNPSGLHARPAATFVKAASGFRADLQLTNLTRNPERSANAKSVIGVMGLGVSSGHQIRLTADGPDAQRAIDALAELVESGIGEQIEP
jgi:phosphotransferase system HPr (HPr) family protein